MEIKGDLDSAISSNSDESASGKSDIKNKKDNLEEECQLSDV